MRNFGHTRSIRRTIVPISLNTISEIKNENVLDLIELFNRKYRELDVVHQISHLLENVL